MSWWWWWQCQYQYQYQLSPVINMCVVCVVYEAEWRVQPKHDWLPRYPAIQTPPQPAQDTPLILQANSEQDSPFNITNCIIYYAYIDTTVFQERFEPLFTPLLVYSETRGGKLWRNFVILFFRGCGLLVSITYYSLWDIKDIWVDDIERERRSSSSLWKVKSL